MQVIETLIRPARGLAGARHSGMLGGGVQRSRLRSLEAGMPMASRPTLESGDGPALPEPLALAGGGDAHGLSVLGDRPAGDPDAGLLQQGDQLAVGERLARGLFLDQLADAGADGGAGVGVTLALAAADV